MLFFQFFNEYLLLLELFTKLFFCLILPYFKQVCCSLVWQWRRKGGIKIYSNLFYYSGFKRSQGEVNIHHDWRYSRLRKAFQKQRLRLWLVGGKRSRIQVLLKVSRPRTGIPRKGRRLGVLTWVPLSADHLGLKDLYSLWYYIVPQPWDWPLINCF